MPSKKQAVKRRRGRPPLPASQRKERLRQLAIKVSPAELARMRAMAALAGMPVSTWARELLLRASGHEV